MSLSSQLASASAVRLGEIGIEPSLLEVSGPMGVRVVEPRVMQTLVVLAGAGGRPVTRDHLVATCWGNRAVSEDAINRAVAKLRTAFAAACGPAIRLETIRGVGYRLVVATASPSSPAADIVPAIDLETRALGAMFEGTRDGSLTAVHYLEEAVAQQPDNAPVWGSLAMAYVLNLPFAGNRLMHVAASARQAALRAQRLSADEGRSLAALASFEPTYGAWAEKDRMLRDMLGRAPVGTAPLLFQRILYLASVGRMAAALEILEPLASAAPLVPWIQSARAHGLAACGSTDEALGAAQRAHLRWPRNRLCWFTFFHLSLHAGKMADAFALIDYGPCDGLSDTEYAFAADLAHACAAPSINSPKSLIDRFERAFAGAQSLVEQAAMAAALLRQPDHAVRLLHRLYAEPFEDGHGSIAFPKIGLVGPGERNTAILFLAPMEAVRAQARFSDNLQLTGLAAHDASGNTASA